ncbi:MAG: DUF1801 domain-containing protein [Gemmatimonadetes bacterium]|nr:DUF1801 domain-containing protein [Gemmatimonadota bacterium]
MPSSSPASAVITKRIRELGGWRGKTLAQVRKLVLAAHPEIVEEWKWEVPVWSCNGIICTGETYAKAVKLTFANGATVPDPARLFNASLAGNKRRAIDIREGETLNARAFTALIKAAVARNVAGAKSPKAAKAAKAAKADGWTSHAKS